MLIAHEVSRAGSLRAVEWLELFRTGESVYAIDAAYINPAESDDIRITIETGGKVLYEEELIGDFFTLEIGLWFALGVLAEKFRPRSSATITFTSPVVDAWLRNRAGDPFTLKDPKNIGRLRTCNFLIRRLCNMRRFFVCDAKVAQSYYDDYKQFRAGKKITGPFAKAARHCMKRNAYTARWRREKRLRQRKKKG